MSVESKPLNNPPAVDKPKRKGPQIGVISGGAVETAFIRALYVAAFLLAVLSLLGTFYGFQGKDAPIATPVQIALDVYAAPAMLGWAFVAQLLLTLAQWAGRHMAKRDPRWWLGYLAALGVSVYYNIVSYLDPSVALGVPWLLAVVLIIGADALPELIVVRGE